MTYAMIDAYCASYPRPPPNRTTCDLPRTVGGKVITCRALHRVAALEAPNQTYSASKWSIFNRPIWREFTRRRHHQQLSLFDAHYDERCFLPIHIYETATSRHGRGTAAARQNTIGR